MFLRKSLKLRKFINKRLYSDINFDLLKPKIKVLGVGGAGCNAIHNMTKSNLTGMEFIACNTDIQSLNYSGAQKLIQLGKKSTKGMGAGSVPDKGKEAAEESLDEVLNALEGCNMLFLTAGMGGGTGSGATSVIAKACKTKGILTVGVVTKPFDFEGKYRSKVSEKGLEELSKTSKKTKQIVPNVDTLLVIPNQKLIELYPKRTTTLIEAFNIVDTVLYNSIKSVSDLMLTPGLINLDFADLSSVMKEMGRASMGMGESDDPHNRAIKASEMAIHNPLLDSSTLRNAKGIIINICGGNDLTLMEIQKAAERIRQEVDEETNIIFGSSIEESLEGRIRVSVIATGLDQ